jgi:4-hydroxy-3-polyprenylbenzoate decarboxylase
MAFRNLREFLAALEQRGELRRIAEPVSPALEITEWADRAVKSGGPALLFERVVGSTMPVAINVFGSRQRTALALGVNDVAEIAAEIEALLHQRPPETLAEKLRLLPRLLRLGDFAPTKVASGPCQEVAYTGERADLGLLPALQCWPHDGGRYLTLTNVFTRDLAGRHNCGMYRIQVFDRNTAAVHVHVHHDGARHLREWEASQKPMPMAVAIGADPAVTYSATAPLPPDMDEMLLAGFIRRAPVEMAPCLTQPDLRVPAEAEIVVEGYVAPGDRRREGPFGDHTGFYTPPADCPVFHVTAITHRRDPIYQTIVVGPPPMEDTFLGKATERIFRPLVRLMLPEIVDINMPIFGVFHNCVFVSIHKQYAQHARKVMHGLWGLGQFMLAKMIVVVDADVDVQNEQAVLFSLGANCDFARDLEPVRGPTDMLDHATAQVGWGGKLGIDATRKWPEEGVTRPWPEALRMAEPVKARVSEQMKRAGLL